MGGQAPTAVADPGTTPPRGPLESVGQDLGIPALGEAPWGTHLCQFYGGREDLLDVLVPYFRGGLDNHEQCVLTTATPLEVEDAVEELSERVDGFERGLASGQVLVVPPSQRYTSGGRFDGERVLGTIVPAIEDALAQGYSGRRSCTNESWLSRGDWDAFMAGEAAFTGIIAGHRSISMCAYPLPACDAGQLVDVLLRHQYALLKQDRWTLIEPSEHKRATALVERMNLALAQRTTELQSALADLRGVSRWVTHDLRAPLASITSYGNLFAQQWGEHLDEDGRAVLGRILAGAARMDTLITSILAYSDAQHTDLHPAPVDLRALVTEVWPSVSATETRRTTLQVEALPLAHADRRLLAQALAALLRNARQATAYRPDGLVEVGAVRTADGGTAYQVRDNGIGFDPRDAETVFHAFTRLHSVGESDGAGLGLALVKTVVTRHGGQVWADSTPGLGATFSFTLPDPTALPDPVSAPGGPV